MRRPHLGSLLLALLPLGGCVTVGYTTTSVEQPIDERKLATLEPGASLASCLATLGGPQRVFEYRGDGLAIGYGHRESSDWSVNVSYSFERFVSLSVEGEWGASDLPGVVLWFDADLRLLEWRRGLLGELLPARRQPPAPVLDDAPTQPR